MHRFVPLVSILASLCLGYEPPLLHITGTQRLTQVFIRHRYLAVRVDGTVAGTTEAHHPDTVLQRVSHSHGRILLRNAVSCMHVCLDRCGAMYASAALSSDCVLNEIMLENNYDVLYKIYNGKKTYVALDNDGRPRRVQLPRRRPLRNMSVYTRILCKPIKHTAVIGRQCPRQNETIEHRKCRVS
ncbi:FGF [Dione juno nucleopolyhedrovirus]|uniref:FGF n=1 Tax=Dione juno nucleopolyhedrovirus TaxID=2594175 RepID=A0AAE6H3H2_9ABAC|nr:FGF [Dione juno nucleopolyhedrovirus]QDL57066.1 FGF [Dione juno nucleopolyhedrovirus]